MVLAHMSSWTADMRTRFARASLRHRRATNRSGRCGKRMGDGRISCKVSTSPYSYLSLCALALMAELRSVRMTQLQMTRRNFVVVGRQQVVSGAKRTAQLAEGSWQESGDSHVAMAVSHVAWPDSRPASPTGDAASHPSCAMHGREHPLAEYSARGARAPLGAHVGRSRTAADPSEFRRDEHPHDAPRGLVAIVPNRLSFRLPGWAKPVSLGAKSFEIGRASVEVAPPS